jgi:hypothetical protein
MTWTAPRTWVAGEFVTDSVMNTHVRDNITSLAGEHFISQTFRGLVLGTHPDSDKEGTRVWLHHADEIVMQDGFRVGPWDALQANVGVSGAGGLDTGAVAASTWYEIYAIRKSSDGTKNLLLHKAKNFEQDETQDVDDTFWEVNGGATPATRVKVAQKFSTDFSGVLPFVEVKLRRVSTVGGTVTFTIEADVSGAPSGVALATSNVISVLNLTSGTSMYVMAHFPVPATIVAGTNYWLVAQVSAAGNTTDYLSWRATTTNPYARGNVATYNGSAWTNQATNDACFRIYVERAAAAVVMPSGYDQYALIGYTRYVTTSLFPFRQYDRTVRTPWSNVVNSQQPLVPTVINAEAQIPPAVQPQAILGALGDVAGDAWTISGAPDWGGSWAQIASWMTIFASTAVVQSSIVETPVRFQRVYFNRVSGTGNIWIYVWGYRW